MVGVVSSRDVILQTGQKRPCEKGRRNEGNSIASSAKEKQGKHAPMAGQTSKDGKEEEDYVFTCKLQAPTNGEFILYQEASEDCHMRSSMCRF